jgi:hypothetical protein
MKQIHVASSAAAAEIVAAELRAAGIEAVVQGESDPIPTSAFPSVWVPEVDFERARELIGDLN